MPKPLEIIPDQYIKERLRLPLWRMYSLHLPLIRKAGSYQALKPSQQKIVDANVQRFIDFRDGLILRLATKTRKRWGFRRSALLGGVSHV